jgi:hypothetical protein
LKLIDQIFARYCLIPGRVCVALFVGIGMLAAAMAPVAADTGSSHNLFIKTAVDARWFVSSRSNVASRDGVSDVFFGFADLNLGFRLSDAWSAEAGYRHARLKLRSGWRDEYRPLLNLAWRRADAGWAVSNRHRLELRFFEGTTANDRVRYRNETRVVAPRSFAPWGLRPYLEEEFFYEFTGAGLNLNWVSVGVTKKLSNKVRFKLGYRWQAQKFGADWDYRHVLVTGLSWLP